jgi:hypothetical protein
MERGFSSSSLPVFCRTGPKAGPPNLVLAKKVSLSPEVSAKGEVSGPENRFAKILGVYKELPDSLE